MALRGAPAYNAGDCLHCRRCTSEPWVGKIPWRRKRQPTPVFLPGKSHWTEEPLGLESTGSQRVRHNSSDLACTQRELDSICHNSRVYTLPCSKTLCAAYKTWHGQINQYFLKIQGRNLFGSFLLPPPSPRSTSQQWGTRASLARCQVGTKLLVSCSAPVKHSKSSKDWQIPSGRSPIVSWNRQNIHQESCF